MTPAARERLKVAMPMLIIGAGSWVLLIAGSSATTIPMFCSDPRHGVAVSFATLGTLLWFNSPLVVAFGWALMLTATMAPTLIAPLTHLRNSSFARRRARSVALFVAGYGAIWMAAGAVIMILAMAMRLLAPASPAPLVAAVTAAAFWQCSPVKQRCLNRCHAFPAIAAFGISADVSAVRYGATYGSSCVGSCWLLMLLPSLIAQGHLLAMAVVTVLQFAERLESPTVPRWSIRGPRKAWRIVLACAALR